MASAFLVEACGCEGFRGRVGVCAEVTYGRDVRVLVSTQPAYGHLHPLVPLAAALSEAGHDVLLASSRSFQPQLKATGLRAISAGVDCWSRRPRWRSRT